MSNLYGLFSRNWGSLLNQRISETIVLSDTNEYIGYSMNEDNIEAQEKREIQRIEFGLSGAQARKWVAEVIPGQSIRIVGAEGSITVKKSLVWKSQHDRSIRTPETAEKEGALLLIIESDLYKYKDIKNKWIVIAKRSQVYIGIQDSRHDDNKGTYSGILEIDRG